MKRAQVIQRSALQCRAGALETNRRESSDELWCAVTAAAWLRRLLVVWQQEAADEFLTAEKSCSLVDSSDLGIVWLLLRADGPLQKWGRVCVLVFVFLCVCFWVCLVCVLYVSSYCMCQLILIMRDRVHFLLQNEIRWKVVHLASFQYKSTHCRQLSVFFLILMHQSASACQDSYTGSLYISQMG